MKASAITKAIGELGIDRDSVRVLGLLPLVYVAWADGTVQRCERTLIHKLAANTGGRGGNGETLLSSWLDEPPSDDYVRKGFEVLRALADQQRGIGAGVDEDTLRSLVAFGRDVAAAAGGMFGLTDPIDDDEADALAEIASALGLDDDNSSWQSIADRAEQHDQQLPPGPAGHFLVGSLPEFLNDPLSLLTDSSNRHGDVVFYRLAGEKVYMLRRPEHIEHVLQTNGRNYVRGLEYRNLAKLIGDSLLTTDGEAWRKLRRISQPAFHNKHLAGFGDTIGEITARMLDRWGELEADSVLDISPEMMRLTLEIIGLLMFSKDLSDASSDIGQAVSVVLEQANDAMINPLRIPTAVPTPDNLRFKRAMKVFDELLYGIIKERRADDAPEHNDLLAMLMSAEDADSGERLTDEQLHNEMLTFLLAGHETTSIGLMWTFYALSKHPAVARCAYAEIDEQLGGEQPGADDAGKCSYTNKVIDEAMRLYPPVWALGREAVSDDEIGGYRIPKGALIFLSQWVTHRDPSVWDNPEGFDPDRFDKDKVASRHRMAYFPFAAGPHKCIGMALSLLEMRLIVPMVLQRYRLDLEPGFVPIYDPQVTLRSKNGMRMRLRGAPS